MKEIGMAVLGAAAMVAAAPAMAGPFDGAWKSNTAKSYWSNGPMPQGFSLTINLKWDANSLTYHSVNDTDKAKPMTNDFVASLDDRTGPLLNNARFNEIRIRRLGARTFQVLEQKDGDVIVGQYWEFAADGKSLIRWGVGKAPDGKSKAFLEWFDKVR